MARYQPRYDGPNFWYGYARVSHPSSTASGISIETQIDQISKRYDYMKAMGKLDGIEWGQTGWWGTKNEGEATTDGWFVDRSVSAFKVELGVRPAGRRLNAILHPGDHICFSMPDRAVRKIKDFSLTLHRWVDRGIKLHFVTPEVDPTSPFGLAFLQMSVIFAELDSNLKSQRIRDCFAVMRAQNRPTSRHKPFGWKKAPVTGQYIPDLEERALGLEMLRLREEEKLSWYKISDRIEEMLAKQEGRKPIPLISFRKGERRKYDEERCQSIAKTAKQWLTPSSHVPVED